MYKLLVPVYLCNTPFWTFGEVCLGFQCQGGFPGLRVLSPTCNLYLRFASGAKPADLLAATNDTSQRQPYVTHNNMCICLFIPFLQYFDTFRQDSDILEKLILKASFFSNLYRIVLVI